MEDMPVLSRVMIVKGVHLEDDLSTLNSEQVNTLLKNKGCEIYIALDNDTWLWYAVPNQPASYKLTQIYFDQTDKCIAKDFIELGKNVGHFKH